MKNTIKNRKPLAFEKIDGTKIENTSQYIKDYISQHPDYDYNIMIGCDSLPKKYNNATYTVTIILYRIGKGGHIIFNREHNVRTTSLINRLWEEVERSVSVAQYLKDENVLSMKNVKAIDVNLHLDINESEEHKSNSILKAAVGYITSMGFKCSTKPDAPAASYAADKICRHEMIQGEYYADDVTRKI